MATKRRGRPRKHPEEEDLAIEETDSDIPGELFGEVEIEADAEEFPDSPPEGWPQLD